MKQIIKESQNINSQIAIFKVKGVGEITVEDNGTNEFVGTIRVNSNYGSKTVTKTLSKNESFDEKINIVNVHADISNWQCRPTHLSFNLRIKAWKKELLNINLSGDR